MCDGPIDTISSCLEPVPRKVACLAFVLPEGRWSKVSFMADETWCTVARAHVSFSFHLSSCESSSRNAVMQLCSTQTHNWVLPSRTTACAGVRPMLTFRSSRLLAVRLGVLPQLQMKMQVNANED